MEHEKQNFVHRDDSIFSGAIFMSNRETKLECLQRKLFGLPHSKAKFLKQVKSGMILFLFEHEERKLYGVFEATSDGAFNIIPEAFRSTGQSYPAQILFKRIWMCKPLCEDEFRSAIGENYYSPNKFHFGLSYEQVIKLTHLFYSKKINIKQYQRSMKPQKNLEKLENSDVDEARLTETGTYFNCESDEYSREGNREIRKQHALPQASFDPPMHYTRSNQVNSGTFDAQLSDPRHSYSETLNSQSSSMFLPHDDITFHHFPIRKQSSTTSEIDYKPLPQQSSTNLDNMASYLFCSSPVTVSCRLPFGNHTTISRMVGIEEAGGFTCVSEAQPNQVFEFPDYIPLLEESPQKFVNNDNQNFSPENSEYIPCTVLNSKAFRSDVESSDLVRTSVFSRLSRDPKVCNHETPEPSSSEPPSGLSYDQLLKVLAARRKWWGTEKGQNSEHQVEISEKDEYEGFTETEQVAFTDPFDSDQSNEVVSEESFKIPFYNFRRRNMSQKYEVNDVCCTEATPVKSKRRKIVRPSLSGEMNQDVKGEEVNILQNDVACCSRLCEPVGEMNQNVKGEEVNILESDVACCSRLCEPVGEMNQNVKEEEVNILESDVACCSRLCEHVGESVEQNQAICTDGPEDYIPLE